MKVRVQEKKCKTLLGRSRLSDYTLNCYTGCSNGCRYCYAKYVGRYAGHEEELWGSYVDVKINALEVLKKEIERRPPGRVFVSSACDAWQQEEEEWGLSRQAVRMLLDAGFRVNVLTKSERIVRDLDAFSGKAGLCVGVTLTAIEERLRRAFEPRSSSYAERLRILREANRRGMETFAMLAPLWPYLTDTEEHLRAVMKDLAKIRPTRVGMDFLNPRWSVWPGVREVLGERYPFLLKPWQRFLFDDATRARRIKEVTEVYADLQTELRLG